MAALKTGKDALEAHRLQKEGSIKDALYNPNSYDYIPIVGRFEKVSYETFEKSCLEYMFPNEQDNPFQATINTIKKAYDAIELPNISTEGSVGHDFVSPFNFTLETKNTEPYARTMVIPTGIKCAIKPGWFLSLLPRSSNGFNHRLQLDNTMGVIDYDYYNNKKTEGHIMIKITCASYYENHIYHVDAGDKFAQGIFLIYGLAANQNTMQKRDGGMGSTGK